MGCMALSRFLRLVEFLLLASIALRWLRDSVTPSLHIPISYQSFALALLEAVKRGALFMGILDAVSDLVPSCVCSETEY